MDFTVHVQLNVGDDGAKLAKQLIESGFSFKLVNKLTCEMKSIWDDDSLFLKARSSYMRDEGWLIDCLFNSETAFPSERIIKTLLKTIMEEHDLPEGKRTIVHYGQNFGSITAIAQ